MSLRRVFGLLIAVALLVLVSRFVLPIAMGAILSVALYPLQRTLERRKFNPSLAAALITLVLSALVLMPFATITVVATRGALHQFRELRGPFENALRTSASAPSEAVVPASWVDRLRAAVPEIPIERKQLVQTAEDTAKTVAARVGEWLGHAVSQLPALVLGLFFSCVGLFFSLTDGRKFLGWLEGLSPYTPKQTQHLLISLRDACRSVILAGVATGAVQGLLALVFFAATGLPNPLFLSIFVFIFSFVPLIGAAPLLLGAVVYLAIQGTWTAVAGMLVGWLMIAFSDNLIRPLILVRSMNLHPLLAFLAALGGLQWLGFPGIFIGPILASFFVAIVQIDART